VTIASEELRLEILALRPALRAFADGLTADDDEASDLVHLTMAEALVDGNEPARSQGARSWLFGVMRREFHSVARRRQISRARGRAAPARLDAALATPNVGG